MWFRNRKSKLTELSLTREDSENKIFIPETLAGNLINLDETCTSLNGPQGNRRGCPSMVFYNPHFPVPAKATSK